MRNFLFVLLAFPFFIWAEEPVDNSKKCEAKLERASDEAVIQAHAIASLLDMGEVREFLKELTGVKPLTTGFNLVKRSNSTTRAIARMAIKEHAERMGYKVEMESFDNGANVIVELPGTSNDNEIIEVTAHYDSVVTGADDNGSGISLMLGMLSLFRETKHERRLRFVFMDLEEQGMQGSEHHVKKILSQIDSQRKVVGAIVIDTIGWAHEKSKDFLAVLEIGERRDGRNYDERLAFAREVYYAYQRAGAHEGLIVSPETSGALPGTTDFGEYIHGGIPAVLIAAAFEDGFRNPHYHMVTDTIENMNWAYFRRVSEATVQMVAYAARMTLQNPRVIGNHAWDLLRSLEDHSFTLADFRMPTGIDRGRSLEYRDRGSWFGRSSWETPSTSPSSSSGGGGFFGWKGSEDEKPKKKKKEKKKKEDLVESAGAASPAGTASSQPHYITRFLESIDEYEGASLYMFFLPPKKDQSSSGASFEANRGFVVAGAQLLNLIGDSDESYALIKSRIQARGGRVYTVQSQSQGDRWTPPAPHHFWALASRELKEADGRSTSISLPTDGGLLRFTAHDEVKAEAKKPRVRKKAQVVEPVQEEFDLNHTIWREE